MPRISIPVILCLLPSLGCAPEERPQTPADDPAITADSRWLMSVLAADSLEGRRAGSEGSRIAARLIEHEVEEALEERGALSQAPDRVGA